MIDKAISHYRIIEKIGSGGMGVVYKAEDVTLKRLAALKFLPPDMTRDAAAKQRFILEARAASALNHAHVTTIYGMEESPEGAFIAMEYIEGRTLKELISGSVGANNYSPLPITHHPLPITQVIDIAIQVAEGLATAHEKGIVHRDIKADNIMITPRNQAKIMDFGLAKLRGAGKLTQTRSTLGTLSYMSPEQAKGEEVDQRSDIFSLGVVLYEMLAGRLPFAGEYQAAIIYAILNEVPQPVSRYNSHASTELERIVGKALAKDREERYQHADELLADLRRERKGLEYAKAGQALPEETSPKSKRRLPPLVLAAAGAVPIIVALGIFGPKLFRVKTPAPEFRKNSIAVMYFEDRSGEENFGKILAEMLISNLSRCKQLDVVSSQHLFDILKKMKFENSGTISRSMATDVARNARVGTMLLGSIDRIGATFSVNAQLCSVSTGSVIGPAQARGPRVEDVYEMVNRLTDEVIQLMDVRLPGDGQALRINDITTHSFEAYKHYQKGQEQIRRFNFRGASEEFESAIQVDGDFAMAHVWLAFSRDIFKVRDPFSDLSPARKAVRLARQHASGISDQEQEFIQVADALFQRDFASMIVTLEATVAKNPDSHMLPWWLGFAYKASGNDEAAIRTWQKLIAADPENVNAHLILAYSHSRRNDHEKAISAIRNYLALLPDVSNSYDSACDIYLKAGMYDEAFRICDEALKANPEWTFPIKRQSYIHLIRGEGDLAREKNKKIQELRPAEMLGLTDDLGCFALHEGRLRQAEADFKTAVQLAREKRNADDELEERLVLGRFYGGQGKFPRASEQFSKVKELSLEISGNSYNTWPVRADYYWGLAALRAGRTDECRAAMQRIQRYVEANKYDEILMHYRHLLLAEIHAKNGQSEEASAAFDQAAPFIRNSSPPCRLLAAEILAMQGKIEKAKQAYADMADDWEMTFSGQGGDFFDYWQVRSMIKYNIARLCKKSGDRAQAGAYYQQALDQWKNADGDMPEYVDAKARLASLKMGK
jgi:serine/threonine protein kinase/tetratricopeptide (TPR) repeat protein